MQVCTSRQTDNHGITPPLCFLQAGCPSYRPTNSVKALKAGCCKMLAELCKLHHSFNINSVEQLYINYFLSSFSSLYSIANEEKKTGRPKFY